MKLIFREIVAFAVGFLSIYLTTTLDFYAIIFGLVFIEFLTVLGNNTSNRSVIFGMAVAVGYLIYAGQSFTSYEYFLYIIMYLIIRFKGKTWFNRNKVNEYLYLLVALSVPIFIDFIATLADIKMTVLLFVTMFLIFLRMSDEFIHSKIPLLIFGLIQIVSIFFLDNFILITNAKVFFIVSIIIWVFAKLNKKRSSNGVRKFYSRKLFRKSR